ncbi:hypothetical protein GCM10029992_66360 [Glycomyces albus]
MHNPFREETRHDRSRSTSINEQTGHRPRRAERGKSGAGSFSDGVRTFTVRASGPSAPDSLNVYADGNRSEVVLVISGLNTGELRATWGPQWRTASESWRDWFEANAFMVFYNGRRPDFRRVRVRWVI